MKRERYQRRFKELVYDYDPVRDIPNEEDEMEEMGMGMDYEDEMEYSDDDYEGVEEYEYEDEDEYEYEGTYESPEMVSTSYAYGEKKEGKGKYERRFGEKGKKSTKKDLKEERKEGDVWKTNTGMWGAMYDGTIAYFRSSEKNLAKDYAKGKKVENLKVVSGSILKESELIFEEVNIQNAIKDFIEVEWSKSDEEKGQALSQLKGIIFDDSPQAKKFVKDLDKLSNSLKVDDYK